MELFGNILDWVLALFLFGMLLFVHELGHFIMCRLTRVKVEEFGFGFPPRLLKLFTWQGTDITLNWIPFGAFVRPTGEDDPAVEGGLAAARKGVRVAVLLGGVIMNALAAVLAYTIAYKIAFPEGAVVISVTPDTPSEEVGLLPGDRILAVDGAAVKTTNDVINYVHAHEGEEITLNLTRNGQAVNLNITPRTEWPEGQGPTGMIIQQIYSDRHNWLEALGQSLQTMYDQVKLILQLPAMILRGTFNASTDRPVGPVGILDVTEQIVGTARETNHWVIILQWIGLINLALAFGNILPIPAFDGGRLLFVFIEAVRGKRVDPEKERMVHGYSLLILILLMLFITYLDLFFPVMPR